MLSSRGSSGTLAQCWRSLVHWRGSGKAVALLALLLANLLVLAFWNASIEREQHGPNGTTTAGLSTVFARTAAACPPGALASTADCKCPDTVLQAIAQLEQLKSELRGGSTNVALQPAPPLPSLPAVADSASRPPLLLIGIPSFPRSSGADYLGRVLEALEAQMVSDASDPMYGQVAVWVMNNAPAGTAHPAFESAREKFAGREREFRFLANDHTLVDPRAGSNDAASPNVPNARVRKQTRDIVRLMQMASGASQYYMAMEDDFLLCANTLPMILHSLRKAAALRRHNLPGGDFVTLKFSYGFNGLLLRNNEDLQVFAQYLLAHQARRPPDHLNTEWSCAETAEARQHIQSRAHVTYRYNLFEHLGTVSSLRSEANAAYPACLHEMRTDVVFEVDAFDFARCDHDDFTPCAAQGDQGWVPPYGIDQEQLRKENKRP